eukprot:1392094-Rhodomonas_salina.1
MRCPVLTWRMLLRACYALSGTDLAYAGTRPSARVHFHGTTTRPYSLCAVGAGVVPTPLLRDVRTDVHYAPTWCPVLTCAMRLQVSNPTGQQESPTIVGHVSGYAPLSAYGSRTECPVLLYCVVLWHYCLRVGLVLSAELPWTELRGVANGTVLRSRHAMSGTDVLCGAMRLRASGTENAYAAMPLRVCYTTCAVLIERTCLRACYAMSGTDLAYQAGTLWRLSYQPSLART